MTARSVELVLFDAVGTLIEPVPAAGVVYRDYARRFLPGTIDDEHRDDHRQFLLAMKQITDTLRRDRQGRTDEAFEYEFWRQVVRIYFADYSLSDVDQLFDELWRHFAIASHWRVFPDVPPTISELQRRGYRVGIASNFDARLLEVCQGHPVLAGIDAVFISSQLGWVKPAPGFYEQIERTTGLSPERILLVGDDYENDVQAPRHRGWRACWLRRTSRTQDEPALRSLTDLLDLLA